MRNHKPGLALIIAAISVLACSKEALNRNNAVNNQNNANATGIMQSATGATSICDKFAYTDTIFYPAELPSDYIVKPINKLSGTYGAFPDGLKINSLNGNIDITESETGLKYIVWFVPSGTTDTCKKFLTVSGVNYT